MPVLVTGGAGFIGCHSAKHLSETGNDVVVYDNLRTGRLKNVRWGPFVSGDIADLALLRQTIRQYGITAVLHLAASAHAGESVAHPDAYYSNNVFGTMSVLDAMAAEGVRALVFASSCAVYGNCDSEKVEEQEPLRPISPYGESKLIVERLLPKYQRDFGLHWAALRYFNAAGAEADLGEDTETSLRIVPRAIHAGCVTGDPFHIYGTWYPTVDGTAVRDYVHVADIARANRLALDYVSRGNPGVALNIGSGRGASVRQIVDAVGCFGREVKVAEFPARPGDPASVVSDASKAREVLGWVPTCSSVATIVETAIASHYRQQQADRHAAQGIDSAAG